MASATFTLKAVDSTASAFASVQGQLGKMHDTVKTVSRNFGSMFGIAAGVAAIQKLNNSLHETEKNSEKLGLLTDEADKLTIATRMIDHGFE